MLLLEDIKKTHTGDSSLHCPHRYRTVILYWPNNRKYHYQRYASLPHATAALFARHSSLTALTSIPDFSIPSYTLPCKNRSRQLLACPHSGSTYPTRPVCIYIFNFQGTPGQNFLSALDKIISGLISPKRTDALSVCYERFCKNYVL